MNPQPQTLVPGTARWVQWNDVLDVRCDVAAEASDVIAQDYSGTGDPYREFEALHPLALDLYVGPVRVVNPGGVDRASTPDVDGGRQVGVHHDPGRAHQGVMQPRDFPTTGLRP